MSLDRLESLIRESPFPWWSWDPRTDQLDFSPLKVTALGYDVADFKGKGYRAFVDLVHPDDYEKTMESMRRLLEGRSELYQIDYRIKAQNGRYRWYMDRGYAAFRDDQGSVTLVRGIVIDLGLEAQTSGTLEYAFKIIEQSLRQTSSDALSFVTICASCRKVKVKDKTYVPVTPELFHLLAEKVSHGICPGCLKKLYPDYKPR